MNLEEEKAALRLKMKERAHSLPASYFKEAGLKICEHIMRSDEYRNAKIVFTFVGIATEPDSMPLIIAALADGKRVCVPLCLREGIMEAKRIESLADLLPGSYGILEPPGNAQSVDAGSIDLILVPCVAATASGKRLGKGGGYYDRYLQNYRGNAILICPREFILNRLPIGPCDVNFEKLASEDGIMEIKGETREIEVIVRTEPGAAPEKLMIESGSSLESVMRVYKGRFRYPIYAARLNNRIAELTQSITEPSEIVFLDTRDSCAKEIYQRSIIALFRKALRSLFPEYDMCIGNSLNRGIYTEIKELGSLSHFATETIEDLMRQMVKKDLPFSEIEHGRQQVVPSAGYLKSFDLKKYHGGIVIRISEDTHPKGLAPYVDNKNLYDAFEIQKEWSIKLGIETCADLNVKTESGEIDDIIRISEALQEKNISDLADEIIQSGRRVILIAGPSSSGKTTFAHRLCTQLWVIGEKPIYIGTDDYYIDRKLLPIGPDGEQNFENLDSIDVELFNENMRSLLEGRPTELPRFHFATGERVTGARTVQAGLRTPIVIEGIHGLNEALTPGIAKGNKFKIYISPLTQIRIDDFTRIPLTDIRKLRRIVRDATKRGWDARQTMENWPKVRAGEDINIFPYSDEADAVFNSAFVYELAALKKYAEPMLSEIPEDDEYYCEALRLLRLLNQVEELEDSAHAHIAGNSILREFIGGSTIV